MTRLGASSVMGGRRAGEVATTILHRRQKRDPGVPQRAKQRVELKRKRLPPVIVAVVAVVAVVPAVSMATMATSTEWM